LPNDLPHSRLQVKTQLNDEAMDGFIKAYFESQTFDRSPVPMRFCRPQDVPVTAALARSNTVCDNWFAAIPTDTQPNRLMALSGTTKIDATSSVKPPLHLLPNQSTVLDWLETKSKSFEIYVDADPIADVGVPSNLLLMASQWKHVLAHGHTLDKLAAAWASPNRAPNVIVCEPFYNDFATAIGMHGNCNHPPLPIGYGEDFLRRVYNALTSNAVKWQRTVLVIYYDEHGGFFDHVEPPSMRYEAPPGNSWENPAPFDTLGVRIPGIVVSPLVESGSVFKGLLDHTSLLQLLVDRFGDPVDLAYFGDAAGRKGRGVQSLTNVLTRVAPRKDIVTNLSSPQVSEAAATTPPISALGRMFRGVIADKPAKLTS
jgi:phospholipase C